MSKDDIAKERDFLANLTGNTGQDLDAWMAAIDASAHTERNDIIDWLRDQGFTFSKASWLERIYHNNGKPIYIVASETGVSRPERPNFASPKLVTSNPAPEKRGKLQPVPDATPEAKDRQPPVLPATTFQDGTSSLAPADAAALETTLNMGKAYRPLAQYLLREITLALPSASCHPTSYAITIANPKPFAVLDITTKGLRFALSLNDTTDDSPLKRAKFPHLAIRVPAQISQGLTHLVQLTDARQVNDVLISEITRSNQYVNNG